MKIYDCFAFFNELDLLELRLNTLDKVVDYFVLAEASVTHTGIPKPFYYELNKEKFSKFNSKIIHIKLEDIPDDFSTLPLFFSSKEQEKIYTCIRQADNFNRYTEPHYGRDFYQKESPILGLTQCNDEDIIILSDVDEIPNPEILSRLDEFYSPEDFYTFNQKMYCYYFNLECFSHINNSSHSTSVDSNWKGSRMGSYKQLKNYSFNKLRVQDNHDILDGGWHFSYMGGTSRVIEKIKASSAVDWDNPHVMTHLEKNLNQEQDVIYRGDKLHKVPIDSTYPSYFLNNLNKFKHFIKQ